MCIRDSISREAERFTFLKDSEGLSENDKNCYNAIISVNDGKYAMDEKLHISSLQVLSQLLFTHFGRKAIIIVDEYEDVYKRQAHGRSVWRQKNIINSKFGGFEYMDNNKEMIEGLVSQILDDYHDDKIINQQALFSQPDVYKRQSL